VRHLLAHEEAVTRPAGRDLHGRPAPATLSTLTDRTAGGPVGVSWGIERTRSRWTSKDRFLDKWSTFAALDLCRRFRVPYDDEVHLFERADDGTVTVTARREPDLLAGIAALSTPDGTYDQFGPLTDASFFVPDNRRDRAVTSAQWEHAGGSIIVASLDKLYWMKEPDVVARPLARELHLAGRFAEEHDLVVSIGF
jgi:hypothetical protein